MLVALTALACGSSAGTPVASSPASSPARDAVQPAEAAAPAYTVRTIPLDGPLANPNAEVSGLAWHGSDLILLPQHPFRMSGKTESGLLFALSSDDIEAFLSGRHEGPLRPRPVPFWAPGLESRSPVYQGCEALAFDGDDAYVAVEAVADAETGAMRGYLYAGRMQNDTLRLDTQTAATLPPQTDASNMAYEALLAPPGRLVALYEANGRNVNPNPRAHAFSRDLEGLEALAFPTLEYRLTDASTLDERGRFWIINYLFPGERDKLDPAPLDSGPSHTEPPASLSNRPVERLIEFHLGEDGFARTDTPPIPLSLLPDAPRNWEGLARFRSASQGAGFLLVTDQYPRTMLGFVAAPEARR